MVQCSSAVSLVVVHVGAESLSSSSSRESEAKRFGKASPAGRLRGASGVRSLSKRALPAQHELSSGPCRVLGEELEARRTTPTHD